MHRASTSGGSPFAGIEAGGVSYSIHPLELCEVPAWVAILPDGVSRPDMLCPELRLLWPARPGGKALARQAFFFGEGREPKTKFNRGLSTAAHCCSPLPSLHETWQPRYGQPQSRGLCLISEGGTIAAWGSEHDGLSSTSG